MAESGAKIRCVLFYQPADEVLQTQWDVGTVDEAISGSANLDTDNGSTMFDNYIQNILDELLPILSDTVRVIGVELRPLNDPVTILYRSIIDQFGSMGGPALANNCYMHLQFLGPAVPTGNPPQQRPSRSSMKLSGFALSQQEAGRWDSATLDSFNVDILPALGATFDAIGDGIQYQHAMGGDRQLLVDSRVALPVVARMKQRVGNRTLNANQPVAP